MRSGTLTGGSCDILRLLSQHQGENIWNKESFQHALYIGLGRVILYLQNHDDTPYRDIILDACLHNTTYNIQVDEPNAQYIKNIIDLSSDPDFYKRPILDKAASISFPTSLDDYHLIDMAMTFAIDGEKTARKIIYDVFENGLATVDYHYYDEQIVTLDGLDGLLHVMDKHGTLAQTLSTFWTTDHLIEQVKEETGRTDIDDILAERRNHNPNVDAYMRAVEKWKIKNESRQYPRRDAAGISYQQIKAAIENGERLPFIPWGRQADEESLLQAAMDLLKQTDKNKLRTYLTIFFRRAFPLDPQPIIDIINQSTQPTELAPAFTVLKNMQHPAVRTFALKLIEENRHVGRAIGLLTNNFKKGDWAMIDELSRQERSIDDYDDIQYSVRQVFELNPLPEAIPALINVYERGPSSFGRKNVLKQLHSLDAISLFIAEECCWDSDPDIWKWARNGFVDPED